MVYYFSREQKVPISKAEAWEFFRRPENLGDITPPGTDFSITSNGPLDEMYPGMIISYWVGPFGAIGRIGQLEWVSEITHVIPGEYFVDEQRYGPFAFWHHEHHLEEIPGGVKMIDRIHYKLPLQPFSRIIHPILVKPRLKAIFDFRKEAIEKKFGILE